MPERVWGSRCTTIVIGGSEFRSFWAMGHL